MRKVAIAFTLVLVCLMCIGCDNGSSSPNGQDISPVENGLKTGIFVDAPTAGLSYKTSSGITGVTDGDGKYNYKAGDTELNFTIEDF